MILDPILYESRSGVNHHFYVPCRTEYEEELKVRHQWRGILHQVFGRIGKKSENIIDNRIGYSAIDLKEHLESLFEDWMTWENYGAWEIDHITCVSQFHRDTDASVVNSLSNLRPLCEKKNKKRKKTFTKTRTL